MACSAATATARQPDFARHQGQIGHRGRQIQLESRLDPAEVAGLADAQLDQPRQPMLYHHPSRSILVVGIALPARRPQARNPRRLHHRRQPRPQGPRIRPLPGPHNRGLRPQLHLRHRGSRRRSRLAHPHPSPGPGQRRLPRPPRIVPPPSLPRRPKPGRVGLAPPARRRSPGPHRHPALRRHHHTRAHSPPRPAGVLTSAAMGTALVVWTERHHQGQDNRSPGPVKRAATPPGEVVTRASKRP